MLQNLPIRLVVVHDEDMQIKQVTFSNRGALRAFGLPG